MTNEKIKEMLLDIQACEIDFTVIQTGKESKRVNGFYKPDTHEIYLHNLNFKSENELVYTAVHEFTHHLMTIKRRKVTQVMVQPARFILRNFGQSSAI